MPHNRLAYIGYRKYRQIILAASLFVVFSVSALVATWQIAHDLQQSAIKINVSGRQRMLSQRWTKTLLQLEDALTSETAIQPALYDELISTVTLFDNTLEGFLTGGSITGGNGELVQMPAITGSEARVVLEEANNIWRPIYDQMQSFLQLEDRADLNQLLIDNVRPALNTALDNNLILLGLMNDLTYELEKLARVRTQRLRVIQVVSVLLALVNFALLVFSSMRHLASIDTELTNKAAEVHTLNEELSRSEAHMRTLLQALPDGFVRIDRAGRYLEVHVPEGFQPVKPMSEILGKTIDDVLPAAVATQIYRHLEQLFATGQMQKHEYILEMNGQTHYREVRWVRLGEQEAFGLVRDITEQKRVEEALKQSEALFRSLFESSALGIALLNDVGQLVDVNAAFCTLLGYERHELIGLDPKTITHPDDVALTLTFPEGNRYQIEKRYVNKQGQVLWLLVSATRLQTSADQPVTIIKHVQDISAQKKLERALQASQQRLESIVTTLPDMVLTLAADNTVSFSNASSGDGVLAEGGFSQGGTPQAVATQHNMARAADVGSQVIPLPDIGVGQNFKDIIPLPQRAKLLNAFERVRSQGGMAQLEVCLPALTYQTPTHHPDPQGVHASNADVDIADVDISGVYFGNIDFDGSGVNDVAAQETTMARAAERWFLLRVRPGEAGSHELIVVMTDISDIKRSTMRLERALTERTTLLKEIHHRVKNNMQVISSLLHLRAQTLANDEQGQVARASLRDSHERIRAMALVHEVMYETEHFDAVDFRIYLNKLLRIVMQANRIDDVKLALALEPVTLHIDQAIPCGLIVNELLSNALEHAFRDPVLDDPMLGDPVLDDSIQREIQVSVAQQGREVSLQVWDNGVGLPSSIPSTHLGMTIIESLVTQLEGTLALTNREPPEHGLIASVRFPNALPTTSLDG